MNIDEFKKFNILPKSYWISSTHETNYPVLDKDLDVDLAIIGGGMVGISCAYQLRNEGLNIAILDSGHILQGTTGNTTAKITSQHGLIYDKTKKSMGIELAKQYAVANENAIEEIKKIANEHQIKCDYETQSAYVFTQLDENLKKIHDEVKAADSLGIRASFVDEIPFSFPIKGAVRFDNQAQFHPRKYLLALSKIIKEGGAQIYEQTRVVEIGNHVMDSYVLTTSNGNSVTAKKVIIASHYPFYNKHSMYYSRIYQERSYVVAIKAKEAYSGGMFINEEEPTRSIRGHKSNEGELILIGGENHKTGQSENTNEHYEALVDYANENFTLEDIPYRWSTQDCMTLDGIPYVGLYTHDTPNLFIATGFGKWGMTNSTVSSIILRDLIISGKSPWMDVYNPSRKTIGPSAKNFIVQGVNVAGQLLDGKLSKLPKHIDMKPGDGMVAEVDGKRAGAYRDEDGKLHFVNTTCTHMGCENNWNEAEKSWDCPCHGSRFSIDGEVIDGPAVRPLSFDNDVNTLKKVIKEDF